MRISFLLILIAFSIFTVSCAHQPIVETPDIVPHEATFRWASAEATKLGFEGEDVLVCVAPGSETVLLGGTLVSGFALNIFKVESGTTVVGATSLTYQDGNFARPLIYQLDDQRQIAISLEQPTENFNGIQKRKAALSVDRKKAMPVSCYERVSATSLHIDLHPIAIGASR